MKRKQFQVPTPDGRWLAAEMAGVDEGDLVVFHAGTPGSRYLYEGLVRECTKRSLRVVCASRPGYDGSPRLHGRSYADNPADTLAVMEFLGIEAVYVIGHSCDGGPALADAAKLGDRVRATAASASFAPRLGMGPRWWKGLEGANGRELQAIQEGEAALGKYLEQRAKEMRQVSRPEQITNHPDFGQWYSYPDRECFNDKEVLAFQLKIYSLIGHDHTDGWVDDDFAFYGDWGFDVASISVPVTIWQGGRDNVIPVAHAEWLAENVPGADFELLPDEGHVSLFAYRFGDMLEKLTADGCSKS
jgi:pimeloyl-ACP methyl ester carboxylesterase